MKQEILENLDEKYGGFQGETIGEDITLNELVGTIILEYTEVKLPSLEKELQRFKEKKFTTIGKIELLESMREDMTG